MLVHLTIKSKNKKTGPMPVSTSEKSSCPLSCPWYNKGCYAKYGPLGMHWKKMSNSDYSNSLSWNDFCKKIGNLPRGIIWRHNQAGDLPGKNRYISESMVKKLVVANEGKNGFTYTHKNVLGKNKLARSNRKIIRWVNKRGFTINLSADNLKEADKLMALKIAPVCVVVPSSAENETKINTPKGNEVVICPAARKDLNINCQQCQLCSISNRKVIIGFPAHGAAKKIVSLKAG